MFGLPLFKVKSNSVTAEVMSLYLNKFWFGILSGLKEILNKIPTNIMTETHLIKINPTQVYGTPSGKRYKTLNILLRQKRGQTHNKPLVK